jgi:quinol monooxygenase YgiN
VIIVTGTIEVDPAKRDDFLAAQADGFAEVRQEPGCIEYGLLTDPERPGVVRLLEMWQDVPSFDQHLKALGARAKEGKSPLAHEAVQGFEITRHDVASSSKLA